MIYNTKKDELNEVKIKDRIEAVGFKVEATTSFYPFDFKAHSLGDTIYIEYKKRKVNFGFYPSLLISKHKIDTCLKMASDDKRKFIILIQYNDKIVVCNLKKYMLSAPKVAGRIDREDPNDIAPCYFIENKYFKVWNI